MGQVPTPEEAPDPSYVRALALAYEIDEEIKHGAHVDITTLPMGQICGLRAIWKTRDEIRVKQPPPKDIGEVLMLILLGLQNQRR
jgi:hypothetical protein